MHKQLKSSQKVRIGNQSDAISTRKGKISTRTALKRKTNKKMIKKAAHSIHTTKKIPSSSSSSIITNTQFSSLVMSIGHSIGEQGTSIKMTTKNNFSTSALQPSTPSISNQSSTTTIQSLNHPVFKFIPNMVQSTVTMGRNNYQNNTTLKKTITNTQYRHFSSKNATNSTSNHPKHIRTVISNQTTLSTSTSTYLPSQSYNQKLGKLLLMASNPNLKTLSKRQFMSTVKKVAQELVSGLMNLASSVKNMTNPFRNKRGNTISLDGSVPWKYQVRNIAMIGVIGATILFGGYLILKSILLAMKITFVFLIFHFLRKKLVENAIKRNDLDRAIMFETWGESHSNDNKVAKLLWLANPISWWRRAHHFLSNERRKQERCKEIALEVTQKLQLDTRIPHIFGRDFVIGEMDRFSGELGVEEEELYDGFITIPIYSSAPTVIDLGEGGSNSGSGKRSRITGTDLPNKEAMEQVKKEFDQEFERRVAQKRNNSRNGKKDLDIREELAIMDQIKEEYIESIDPNEDVNYKYKFYKAIPKWKWNNLDDEEKDSIVQGKKETFYNNRNIQDRINILDFEALSLRWSTIKWDLRQNRLPSRDGILMHTSDPQLTEVGSIYAFFSVPALKNIVGEKNDRLTIDALNILTQGTREPFVLEKVFAVGENVERLTLFHKDVAKWSINPSLTKDRTIQTYRQEERNMAEAFKNEEPVLSQTRVVDFDLERGKPVVEAEFVETETVQDNSSYTHENQSNGKIVEAEILKK